MDTFRIANFMDGLYFSITVMTIILCIICPSPISGNNCTSRSGRDRGLRRGGHAGWGWGNVPLCF